MSRPIPVSLLALCASGAAAFAAPGSAADSANESDRIAIGPAPFRIVSDTEIIINGITYDSWDAVAQSGYYQTEHTHCGTIVDDADAMGFEARGTTGDCNSSRTRIEPQYEPDQGLLRIPVVVHVIQSSNGTGFISEARVRSQIDILNQDFLALAGSNGGNGDDSQIEFFLATEDPSGNPTNGITYSTNNTWFNDGGSYWNTLAWDTDRYLNIYTNSASGALGYVPGLPHSGIVGSTSDRAVVLYSTFGQNAPLAPFNLGRTATHEVGHYLGLFHTFNGGCHSTSTCSTSGDRICDTNPESSPTFGCPGSRSSCGLPAPLDNYMDYADDRCMERFTPDQINRMRCTLDNWRTNLAESGPAACNAADIASPEGVLDLGDVQAFVDGFLNQQAVADIAAPSGVWDLGDVQAFINAFNAGCP